MRPIVALVADADPGIRRFLGDRLAAEEVTTLGAPGEAEASVLLGSRPIQLLFVDLDESAGAIERLTKIARTSDPVPLIIGLTSRGDAEAAPLEERWGLFEWLIKPLREPAVDRLLHRALREIELLTELRELRSELRRAHGLHEMVGRSAAIERLRDELLELAESAGSVWFVGETGCGKELAARALHGASARQARPFILLDCASLSPSSAAALWPKSEGRAALGRGLMAHAGGGTIYLQEATALPLEQQAQLLSSLENHASGSRAGSPATETACLLAGSRWDPTEAVAKGDLLQGLQQRLAPRIVRIASLRDRAEDIALLTRHFVSQICELNRLDPIRVSPRALALLESHDWPGNVQELRDAVEQAVILADQGLVRAEDLPETIRRVEGEAAESGSARLLSTRSFKSAKREMIESFEKAYLRELLGRHAGNVTSAARQAGMLRSALQRLLRKYSIRSADYRKRRRPPRRSEARRVRPD